VYNRCLELWNGCVLYIRDVYKGGMITYDCRFQSNNKGHGASKNSVGACAKIPCILDLYFRWNLFPKIS
jgi:hypothetical protein